MRFFGRLAGRSVRAITAIAPTATTVTTQNCQSPHGTQPPTPTALITPYTIAAAT